MSCTNALETKAHLPQCAPDAIFGCYEVYTSVAFAVKEKSCPFGSGRVYLYQRYGTAISTFCLNLPSCVLASLCCCVFECLDHVTEIISNDDSSLTPHPSTSSRHSQIAAEKHPLSKSRVPQGTTSAPSTTSEDSSQSSSSGPSGRQERKSATSTPPEPKTVRFTTGEDTPPVLKMESGFGDEDDTYQMEDSGFPSVGVGMDNLSLNPVNSMNSPDFKFSTSMASPDSLSTGLFLSLIHI